MWQNPAKATVDTKNSAKATFRQNAAKATKTEANLLKYQ